MSCIVEERSTRFESGATTNGSSPAGHSIAGFAPPCRLFRDRRHDLVISIQEAAGPQVRPLAERTGTNLDGAPVSVEPASRRMAQFGQRVRNSSRSGKINPLKSLLRGVFSLLAKISKRFSRVRLYDWLGEELAKLRPGSKVLCIGAGGKLGGMVRDTPGITVVSIDIDPDKKPDFVMDAANLDFPDGHFDAVFMIEVLEHVSEPQAAVAEIHRVLRDGGSFVSSTPFIFGIHEEPYDFFRYTKYGLLHMFRAFSEVRLRERNGYYASIIVMFMRSIFSPGKHRILIGGVLIVVGLPFFALLLLIDRVVQDERATSGYFTTCIKGSS